MQFIVHTDGGARGNPGQAAVGIVIQVKSKTSQESKEKNEVIEISRRIGEATNNVAEYRAVLSALHEIKNHLPAVLSAQLMQAGKSKIKNEDEKSNIEIQFYLDSTLVVHQLNGMFKVKDPTLRELLTQIRLLEQETGGVVTYAYVPREENRRADFLVNQALDAPPHVFFL